MKAHPHSIITTLIVNNCSNSHGGSKDKGNRLFNGYSLSFLLPLSLLLLLLLLYSCQKMVVEKIGCFAARAAGRSFAARAAAVSVICTPCQPHTQTHVQLEVTHRSIIHQFWNARM